MSQEQVRNVSFDKGILTMVMAGNSINTSSNNSNNNAVPQLSLFMDSCLIKHRDTLSLIITTVETTVTNFVTF
jgi:hypothetical protein